MPDQQGEREFAGEAEFALPDHPAAATDATDDRQPPGMVQGGGVRAAVGKDDTGAGGGDQPRAERQESVVGRADLWDGLPALANAQAAARAGMDAKDRSGAAY